MNNDVLLDIKDLSVSFTIYTNGTEQSKLNVISDLNLTVRRGEITAVAGSSGSGKSLLASAVLGILPENAIVGGSMIYNGSELTPKRQRMLRGSEIALVPQSVEFLDPLMRSGRQADGHRRPYPTEKRRGIFRRLGLGDDTEKLYPFQLSGGMARRVLVSTALITDAQLIIADEPTPGMELRQAVEALSMFREFADDGKAVVLITHDIDLAFEFADRIAVFYAGTTLETEPASAFKAGPSSLHHPYSKALWRALPQNGFEPVPGFQPYAGDMPHGCPYAPRCPHCTELCRNEKPPMRSTHGGEVRCFFDA